MLKPRHLRYFTLLGFLSFMTWVAYRHQMVGGGPAGVPSVDALCPFGGLESLYSYIKSGAFLKRVAPSSLILFGTVGFMTLLLGRVFCGWICPVGALGEAAGRLGNALGVSRPAKTLEPWGRAVKFFILAVVLLLSWRFGTLVMRPYDPWVSWAHLSGGWDEISSSPWGFVVLSFFVVGAGLLMSRFFCRYMCPLGAAMWVLQKLTPTKVHRNANTCINCGACDRACTMGIEVSLLETVSHGDCVSCGECVASCPVRDTLNFRFGRSAIKPLAVGLLGLSIFIGAYGLARITGAWQTYFDSSFEAKLDPVEGIFGWMTLDQAAQKLGMPVDELIRAAGLEEGVPRDVPIKKIPGVDDEALKESIRRYINSRSLPGGDKTLIPDPGSIKGTQTLQEVASQYKLNVESILKSAGWPEHLVRSADVPLRDLARSIGGDVSAIREGIRNLRHGKYGK